MAVEYGTVKALHAIAERIGLIDIVNRAAPKRNGLPVGELAFIMAANRVLNPRPKYTIPEWYQRTYLPEVLGIELPLDSAYQTLTRCLDYLTDEVQADIEMALAARVMEAFHLKPRRHTKNGVEGRIVLLLEKNHCRKLIDWRLVGGRGGRRLKWELNQEAIREEEILDGRYWLMTTLDVSPKEVLEIYRSRDAVERAFRITKETIKIRPIWNRTEEHIKAHLFVCFIAYLLYSLGVKALERLRKFTERAARPRFLPTTEDINLLSHFALER